MMVSELELWNRILESLIKVGCPSRFKSFLSPSYLDTKKIPPFWTECPCRLRENLAGSSGAGFDIEDMGTVLGTVPRSSTFNTNVTLPQTQK